MLVEDVLLAFKCAYYVLQVVLLLKMHYEMRSPLGVYAVLLALTVVWNWLLSSRDMVMYVSLLDLLFTWGCLYLDTRAEIIVDAKLFIPTRAAAAAA